MDKGRKKTLTISSDLKKKIDTTSISTSGKKAFSVEKKNLLEQINHLTNLLMRQTQVLAQILKRKIMQENLLSNKLRKISSKKRINPQEKVNLNLKDQ